MRPPRWGWYLLLAQAVALLLACGSGLYAFHARREIKNAQAVVARADSLVRDWTKRGCAPRTQKLP